LVDLNQLIPAGPLYLFTACSINDRGEIIGIAIDKSSGGVHAYLAVPDQNGDTGERVREVTVMQTSEHPATPLFQRFAIGRR
jgi:hypothetical protein